LSREYVRITTTSQQKKNEAKLLNQQTFSIKINDSQSRRRRQAAAIFINLFTRNFSISAEISFFTDFSCMEEEKCRKCCQRKMQVQSMVKRKSFFGFKKYVFENFTFS
jgi:hypothetical protein